MLSKLTVAIKKYFEKLTYRHWITISAVISVILGILVFFSLNSATKQVEVVPVNNVTVVVAKQDIAPKTIIKESMLEIREIPAHLLPSDAVSNMSDIVNKPAKVEILKDDVLSKRKILMDISMAGFTGDIPPECRAVSIGISDVTGVAGFAQPGDYVDVMLIAKQDNKMVGRIILQDVQLLAINKIIDEPKNTAPPTQTDKNNLGEVDNANDVPKKNVIDKPATATLALTPSDALKLITEAQDGTIYLSLRPYMPKDKFVTSTTHVHYSNVQQAKSNAPATQNNVSRPVNTAPPARTQQAYTTAPVQSGSVEVIRGTSVSREGK